MFRRLPVYEHDERVLVALGSTMIADKEDDKPLVTQEQDEDENTSTLRNGELRLPAGYTYFGQFVDHDITFDPVSSLTRQNDPDALTDFRTPRFDLDSLYGGGPASQPYLYEPGGEKLALGDSLSHDATFAGPDLPRSNGRALIGDPRNDENLIVSQLQVAFIKFHNAVVDHLKTDNAGLRGDDLFKLAQQTVRWHYQWVVIHDYLCRLVGKAVVDDILRPKGYRAPGGKQVTIRPRLLFYDWRDQPFMPVEFSVAAYRFGHSMARPSYLINDRLRPADRLRFPLFEPDCGFSRTRPNPLRALCGFRPLPLEGGVQWKYLLPIEHPTWPNEDGLPQPSYRIDTELGFPLGDLPPSVVTPRPILSGISLEEIERQPSHIRDVLLGRSLAVRNLLRGHALGLPTGQDVARAMGIEPLTDVELLGSDENLHRGIDSVFTVEFDAELLRLLEPNVEPTVTERVFRDQLKKRTPLWFYILREAKVKTGGTHLGPVGGRIVAEVLIGLLAGDPLSYLSVDPTWKPFLGPKKGTFTLGDLVTFGVEGRSPTVSDQHFYPKQKIINQPIMEAVGLIETNEYDPIELQVGIVKVQERQDPISGDIDYDIVAGAYGTGAPRLEDDPSRSGTKIWRLQIQPDSDPARRQLEPGPAFAFVLVRLRGGGFTGWIDRVVLE